MSCNRNKEENNDTLASIVRNVVALQFPRMDNEPVDEYNEFLDCEVDHKLTEIAKILYPPMIYTKERVNV